MPTQAKLLPEAGKKYRLITRSDMVGLICAVILKELDLISEVTFAHPNDMQHGKVPVTGNDITTNLPYVESAYMCFDHHASEVVRKGGQAPNHLINDKSPSCARLVIEYYGGRPKPAQKRITNDMMAAVDQADSSSFSRKDIQNP